MYCSDGLPDQFVREPNRAFVLAHGSRYEAQRSSRCTPGLLWSALTLTSRRPRHGLPRAWSTDEALGGPAIEDAPKMGRSASAIGLSAIPLI